MNNEEKTLSYKVSALAEYIALELRRIEGFHHGPSLFDHISKTLDKPPEILEYLYNKPAGSLYSKTIVLSLQWKNQPLRKHIVLFTQEEYTKSNLDLSDDLYNVYVPYHSAIYAEGNTPGTFDQLVCRKAYNLP
jgi:hypothetical protein